MSHDVRLTVYPIEFVEVPQLSYRQYDVPAIGFRRNEIAGSRMAFMFRWDVFRKDWRILHAELAAIQEPGVGLLVDFLQMLGGQRKGRGLFSMARPALAGSRVLVLHNSIYQEGAETVFGTIERGEYFVLNGELKSSRNRIQCRPGATPRELTLRFEPPIRSDLPAGTELGFDAPVGRFELATNNAEFPAHGAIGSAGIAGETRFFARGITRTLVEVDPPVPLSSAAPPPPPTSVQDDEDEGDAAPEDPAPPGNRDPVADAGPNQSVRMGALVQLDASGSTDPNGDKIAFNWQVLAGAVALSNPNIANPTFIAPSTPGAVVLWVDVTDSRGGKDGAAVRVTVASAPAAGAAPTAPVSPSATADDMSSIIAWHHPASGNQLSYEAQIKAAANPAWSTAGGLFAEIAGIARTTQFAAFAGYARGPAYNLRVRARNEHGASPWATADIAATNQPIPQPAAPTSLTAEARLSSAMIRWVNPTAGTFSRVRVRWWRKDNLNNQPHIDLAANRISQNIPGLSPSTEYVVGVSAFNGTVQSEERTIEFATQAEGVIGPPAAVDFAQAATVTHDSIEWQWTRAARTNSNALADTYRCSYWRAGVPGTLGVGRDLTGATATFKAEGLEPSTQYTIAVTPVDSQGRHGTTTYNTRRTSPAPTASPPPIPPAPPLNGAPTVAAGAITQTGFRLAWQAPAGSNRTGWEVQLGASDSYGTVLRFARDFAHSAGRIAGLTAGTKYYWRVRYTYPGGQSAWRTGTTATIAAGGGAPMPDLSLTVHAPAWTLIYNALAYTVVSLTGAGGDGEYGYALSVKAGTGAAANIAEQSAGQFYVSVLAANRAVTLTATVSDGSGASVSQELTLT